MASGASRELGLQRIGSATRFLAVVAIVGGGVLSAAVAKALPGRSHHPGSTGSANPAPSSALSGGASDSGASANGGGANGAGLNAPPQAPTPVNNPPIVSSGGS
jgi:hypothetical protein